MSKKVWANTKIMIKNLENELMWLLVYRNYDGYDAIIALFPNSGIDESRIKGLAKNMQEIIKNS